MPYFSYKVQKIRAKSQQVIIKKTQFLQEQIEYFAEYSENIEKMSQESNLKQKVKLKKV